MEITPLNIFEIDNHVNKGKTCYLLLYANWCGHCTAFKPVWKDISSETNALNFFSQIESSNIDKIKNKPKYIQNIIGFPTIREITKNEITEYKNKREKQLLKDWIKRKKGGTRKRRRRIIKSKRGSRKY